MQRWVSRASYLLGQLSCAKPSLGAPRPVFVNRVVQRSPFIPTEHGLERPRGLSAQRRAALPLPFLCELGCIPLRDVVFCHEAVS